MVDLAPAASPRLAHRVLAQLVAATGVPPSQREIAGCDGSEASRIGRHEVAQAVPGPIASVVVAGDVAKWPRSGSPGVRKRLANLSGRGKLIGALGWCGLIRPQQVGNDVAKGQPGSSLPPTRTRRTADTPTGSSPSTSATPSTGTSTEAYRGTSGIDARRCVIRT